MYNKLFTRILDSSIWLEPHPTRIVWITMLAAMDQDGYVRFASVRNVAHRAMVTEDEATAAIATLESPDPHSGNPAHEGRRIERVDGGWLVLNAKEHRDTVRREIERQSNRERQRRFRERNGRVTDVTPLSLSEAEAEAEANAEARLRSDSVGALSTSESLRARKTFSTKNEEKRRAVAALAVSAIKGIPQ